MRTSWNLLQDSVGTKFNDYGYNNNKVTMIIKRCDKMA